MGRNIREYEVFQLSHQIVLKIYSATRSFPAEEKYGLTSQMRRSAYSVPMNLIEGGAKFSEGEFKRFVDIAIGSNAELDYQLDLSKDLRYLNESSYQDLKKDADIVGKMLNKLMQKLRKS